MNDQQPLMKCGHTALGRDGKTGAPVCPICIGIVPGADEVATELPNLQGRTAECVYCRHTEPSDLQLPFFESCPSKPHDTFYCGCRGWD